MNGLNRLTYAWRSLRRLPFSASPSSCPDDRHRIRRRDLRDSSTPSCSGRCRTDIPSSSSARGTICRRCPVHATRPPARTTPTSASRTRSPASRRTDSFGRTCPIRTGAGSRIVCRRVGDGDVLPLLEVQPRLGRTFTEAEDVRRAQRRDHQRRSLADAIRRATEHHR